MKKVSEMLLEVGGDLLATVDSKEEMEVNLDLLKNAWNMALFSDKNRDRKLSAFLEYQRPHAPNVEALIALERELRRIFKQKDRLFPTIKNKIEFAEAIETGKDDYIIRAYFTNGDSTII